MKSVGFSIALTLALSLSACLDAQKVAPLNPNGGEQVQENSATLSLPRTALADLGRSATRLVIRAFPVDKGILGTEIRDGYSFAVTDEGLYALEGLPLGEIEFQVALLGENNLPLAEGSLRAVINPGAQTLPQLILKARQPSSVDLDLSLALQLVNFPDTPVTTPTEPEAVRTVLSSYNCQGCHNNGARPSAGLDLQSFPYKNAKGDSLPVIVDKVIKSFTGSDGIRKMPIGPKVVSESETALVKDFLVALSTASETGNQKWVQEIRLSVALGGSERFETTLNLNEGSYILNDRVKLIAGSRYAYSMTIVGPGGSKLYEVIDAVLDVPLDGRVPLKLDLVYQAPSVTLPVVIGQ